MAPRRRSFRSLIFSLELDVQQHDGYQHNTGQQSK